MLVDKQEPEIYLVTSQHSTAARLILNIITRAVNIEYLDGLQDIGTSVSIVS